jgi:hypothetical protein
VRGNGEAEDWTHGVVWARIGNMTLGVEVSMDRSLRCVFVANGEIHAQQVRAFLAAAGIPAAARGESLRNTHGLTLDGIGAVDILVAEVDADRARSLLDAAEAGAFRLAESVEISSNTDGSILPRDSDR